MKAYIESNDHEVEGSREDDDHHSKYIAFNAYIDHEVFAGSVINRVIDIVMTHD